jgi:hypothetical protein
MELMGELQTYMRPKDTAATPDCPVSAVACLLRRVSAIRIGTAALALRDSTGESLQSP